MGRISLSTLTPEPKIGFPAGLTARLAPTPARKGREERNVQWVFLGCPGVGKGTYASRLSQLLGVPHIATGDLVREELASSGPLSQKVRMEGEIFEGFVGTPLFLVGIVLNSEWTF
jgi:adenylate kinase